MMSLAGICITEGVTGLALGLIFLAVPGRARALLKAFPRNIRVGAVLAALALAWSAVEVNKMPLGFVDAFKVWLWILGPLVYFLIMVFMNELLAPRALGGLLMLSASPVLELQRVNESGWTVVLAVLAYIWVVAGMILVLSPYRFRQAAEKFCGSDAACRWNGVSWLALGGLMLVLGMRVF